MGCLIMDPGFSIALEEDGRVVVGTLIEDLEGKGFEMRNGDQIVAVGGVRVEGLTRDEIAVAVRDSIGAARAADTPLESGESAQINLPRPRIRTRLRTFCRRLGFDF